MELRPNAISEVNKYTERVFVISCSMNLESASGGGHRRREKNIPLSKVALFVLKKENGKKGIANKIGSQNEMQLLTTCQEKRARQVSSVGNG